MSQHESKILCDSRLHNTTQLPSFALKNIPIITDAEQPDSYEPLFVPFPLCEMAFTQLCPKVLLFKPS